MKLFIHEILPSTVSRAIFIDTDAFFVSDPALLWAQFDTFNATHAFSMPSHPEMAAPEWFNANRICSCVMLLDLSRLRALHLMHSSLAPLDSSSPSGSSSLSRPAFSALFGSPDPTTGKYPPAALGDQTFWWALIEHAPYAFKHLHYNWEVSACLLDMYGTSLGLGRDLPEAEVKMGNDDSSEEEELKVQLHTWETPHQGEVILPKLVHLYVPLTFFLYCALLLTFGLSSNCLEGPRYHEWSGWDDPKDNLARRWAPAVRYHAGYKWLWLNQQTNAGAESGVVVETVLEPGFADERSG